MKQDKMTMAASVEVRVPFLDHRIIELSAAMGDRLKVRGGEGKYVLKKVARDVLPLDIVNRAKMGFPVPLSLWFREGDRSMGILSEKRTVERGLFEQEFVRNIMQEHRKGSYNFAPTIWNLINLEHWIRIFVEGESVDNSPLPEGALVKTRIPASRSATSLLP